MFADFRVDVSRYLRGKGKKELIYLIFEQGIWAIAVYRFGRWVREVKIPIVSRILKLIAFLLFKNIEILTGISLPASARIGKGFYVGHFGGIILHSDAVLGEHCSIGPGVLIGTRGMGNLGVPILGDNVYVGVGAKLLGGIKIGNNVRIGANAVVLKDVPDDATVVGIPARVVTERET